MLFNVIFFGETMLEQRYVVLNVTIICFKDLPYLLDEGNKESVRNCTLLHQRQVQIDLRMTLFILPQKCI